MATTEEKPVSAPMPPERPSAKSIAERFSGRKPQLDIVGFSAPWRPFASRERRPAGDRSS